jgi:hypothetical protein
MSYRYIRRLKKWNYWYDLRKSLNVFKNRQWREVSQSPDQISLPVCSVWSTIYQWEWSEPARGFNVDTDSHRGDVRHQGRLRTSVWCGVTPGKIRNTNGAQNFIGSITTMKNVQNNQQSSEPHKISLSFYYNGPMQNQEHWERGETVLLRSWLSLSFFLLWISPLFYLVTQGVLKHFHEILLQASYRQYHIHCFYGHI